MALLLCVLVCACTGALGFNVDIPSRVVYKGNRQSMFGFTVQAHIDRDKKMILVGAPEDEPNPASAEVRRPGAVYRCNPGLGKFADEGDRQRPLESCTEMVFDKNRAHNNIDNKENLPIDQKSNQWFGATLSSTGRNGPIVACAPRYVSFVNARLNQRDPVGSCFIAKASDAADVKEFSPCRTSSHGQRKTGVCQAGFSAAIARDGQRLFMGAPGSFYWQGQLSVQNMNQPGILSTQEASYTYDDSYMGYSVTVGDFAGQAIQGVAVGVPRGSDLRGLVVIYTWQLENIKNISGSQIGAYFGYSLASGDIDGDGMDDLIIGAPMFTKPKSDGFEHGRIYVIYQGMDRSYSRNHARTGEISQGRFGLSLTSLGDINYDGFGDVAVGAPYGGERGRGVVYIYHGSKSGIREKYSQAITAEEISPNLQTFGFSLSGGVDLDNNNYTDLAVGAYKSDSVVFLKSRPVVKVMAEVKFKSDSKLISLEEKTCQLRDGTEVACAQIQFCLIYGGINVDQQINFEVSLELDSRQKSSKRMFLLESRSTTYSTHILLTQGRQECRDITVYLDSEIRDKLTPIEVKMTYDLVSQPSGPVVPPVLDQTESIVHTDSLNIQKNCGADNVCVPDLRLSATTPTVNYVLGSSENINLDIKVENSGEDAFEAAYFLHIPAGVTYSKMERLDKNADDVPVYCSVSNKDASGNTTLKCDLGNPMESNQLVKFRVILEVDSQLTSLSFDMNVNSTNAEHGTQYDNDMHMNIGVVIKAQLSIIGTSDPPELHYNASYYEAEELKDDTKLGPQVIHKYNIKNEGPFAVEEAEIFLMWPYQTLEGENLMYMLVQPQWVGDVRCDVARHVNTDNLFVQNPYAFLLGKEKEAMMTSDLYISSKQISGGGGYYGQNYWETGGQSSQVLNSQRANHATTSQVNGNSNSFASGANAARGHDAREQVYSQGSQARGFSNQGSSSQVYRQGYDSQGNRQGYTGQVYRQGQAGGQYSGQAAGTQYSQASGGQYSGHSSSGQSSGSQYSGQATSQSRGHSSGGQVGEFYGGNEERRDFTLEEQENIRRNLAASIGTQGSAYQGSYGQGQVNLGHEGYRPGYQTVRIKNRTIVYDENHNIVSQSETSTEYGALGHEGEAGSSFNTRNSQGSGSQQGFVHGSWGTTETVNSELSRAASSAFRGADTVVVGDEEEDRLEGFGVYAAQSPHNEFKYGIGDVSGSQSSGSGQGSYSSGQQYGGQASGQYSGQASGQYSGQANGQYSGQASGMAGSMSSSGYSHSSRSGGHRSYSSHSEGGFSASDERRDRTRRRRQEPVDNHLKEILEKCEEKYKCAVLRCSTGRLLKGQEVWLALRSRINASVLNEISKDRAVILSSLAAARVARLPVVGRSSDPSWHTAQAQTVLTLQLAALDSGAIPLWVVILAAVVGALLLLLLIYALYKCGFFKRNRPSDHTERQPLNGRDEHL